MQVPRSKFNFRVGAPAIAKILSGIQMPLNNYSQIAVRMDSWPETKSFKRWYLNCAVFTTMARRTDKLFLLAPKTRSTEYMQ